MLGRSDVFTVSSDKNPRRPRFATLNEAEVVARRRCAANPGFPVTITGPVLGDRVEVVATVKYDGLGRVWTDLTPHAATLI